MGQDSAAESLPEPEFGDLRLEGDGKSSEGASIPEVELTECIVECPHARVASVIGSKGTIIQDMMRRTSCKITVRQQDVPDGEPRQVVINGLPSGVAAAKELLLATIERGPSAIQQSFFSSLAAAQPMETLTMQCPADMVRHVIGPKGVMIQEIKQRSGCKITIQQDMSAKEPRLVHLVGRKQQVLEAKALVSSVIAFGPTAIGPLSTGVSIVPLISSSSSQFQTPKRAHAVAASPVNASQPSAPSVPTSSSSVRTQEMDVAHNKVALVIGAKGAVIQTIMKQTGCKVVIKQDMPEGEPRKAQFTGTSAQIGAAMVLVASVIANGPSALHAMTSVGASSTTGYEEITVPVPLVGLVIGAGGDTIRRLQSTHNVKISVLDDSRSPDHKIVRFSGEGFRSALEETQRILEAAGD